MGFLPSTFDRLIEALKSDSPDLEKIQELGSALPNLSDEDATKAVYAVSWYKHNVLKYVLLLNPKCEEIWKGEFYSWIKRTGTYDNITDEQEADYKLAKEIGITDDKMKNIACPDYLLFLENKKRQAQMDQLVNAVKTGIIPLIPIKLTDKEASRLFWSADLTNEPMVEFLLLTHEQCKRDFLTYFDSHIIISELNFRLALKCGRSLKEMVDRALKDGNDAFIQMLEFPVFLEAIKNNGAYSIPKMTEAQARTVYSSSNNNKVLVENLMQSSEPFRKVWIEEFLKDLKYLERDYDIAVKYGVTLAQMEKAAAGCEDNLKFLKTKTSSLLEAIRQKDKQTVYDLFPFPKLTEWEINEIFCECDKTDTELMDYLVQNNSAFKQRWLVAYYELVANEVTISNAEYELAMKFGATHEDMKKRGCSPKMLEFLASKDQFLRFLNAIEDNKPLLHIKGLVPPSSTILEEEAPKIFAKSTHSNLELMDYLMSISPRFKSMMIEDFYVWVKGGYFLEPSQKYKLILKYGETVDKIKETCEKANNKSMLDFIKKEDPFPAFLETVCKSSIENLVKTPVPIMTKEQAEKVVDRTQLAVPEVWDFLMANSETYKQVWIESYYVAIKRDYLSTVKKRYDLAIKHGASLGTMYATAEKSKNKEIIVFLNSKKVRAGIYMLNIGPECSEEYKQQWIEAFYDSIEKGHLANVKCYYDKALKYGGASHDTMYDKADESKNNEMILFIRYRVFLDRVTDEKYINIAPFCVPPIMTEEQAKEVYNKMTDFLKNADLFIDRVMGGSESFKKVWLDEYYKLGIDGLKRWFDLAKKYTDEAEFKEFWKSCFDKKVDIMQYYDLAKKAGVTDDEIKATNNPQYHLFLDSYSLLLQAVTEKRSLEYIKANNHCLDMTAGQAKRMYHAVDDLELEDFLISNITAFRKEWISQYWFWITRGRSRTAIFRYKLAIKYGLEPEKIKELAFEHKCNKLIRFLDSPYKAFYKALKHRKSIQKLKAMVPSSFTQEQAINIIEITDINNLQVMDLLLPLHDEFKKDWLLVASKLCDTDKYDLALKHGITHAQIKERAKNNKEVLDFLETLEPEFKRFLNAAASDKPCLYLLPTAPLTEAQAYVLFKSFISMDVVNFLIEKSEEFKKQHVKYYNANIKTMGIKDYDLAIKCGITEEQMKQSVDKKFLEFLESVVKDPFPPFLAAIRAKQPVFDLVFPEMTADQAWEIYKMIDLFDIKTVEYIVSNSKEFKTIWLERYRIWIKGDGESTAQLVTSYYDFALKCGITEDDVRQSNNQEVLKFLAEKSVLTAVANGMPIDFEPEILYGATCLTEDMNIIAKIIASNKKVQEMWLESVYTRINISNKRVLKELDLANQYGLDLKRAFKVVKDEEIHQRLVALELENAHRKRGCTVDDMKQIVEKMKTKDLLSEYYCDCLFNVPVYDYILSLLDDAGRTKWFEQYYDFLPNRSDLTIEEYKMLKKYNVDMYQVAKRYLELKKNWSNFSFNTNQKVIVFEIYCALNDLNVTVDDMKSIVTRMNAENMSSGYFSFVYDDVNPLKIDVYDYLFSIMSEYDRKNFFSAFLKQRSTITFEEYTLFRKWGFDNNNRKDANPEIKESLDKGVRFEYMLALLHPDPVAVLKESKIPLTPELVVSIIDETKPEGPLRDYLMTFLYLEKHPEILKPYFLDSVDINRLDTIKSFGANIDDEWITRGLVLAHTEEMFDHLVSLKTTIQEGTIDSYYYFVKEGVCDRVKFEYKTLKKYGLKDDKILYKAFKHPNQEMFLTVGALGLTDIKDEKNIYLGYFSQYKNWIIYDKIEMVKMYYPFIKKKAFPPFEMLGYAISTKATKTISYLSEKLDDCFNIDRPDDMMFMAAKYPIWYIHLMQEVGSKKEVDKYEPFLKYNGTFRYPNFLSSYSYDDTDVRNRLGYTDEIVRWYFEQYRAVESIHQMYDLYVDYEECFLSEHVIQAFEKYEKEENVKKMEEMIGTFSLLKKTKYIENRVVEYIKQGKPALFKIMFPKCSNTNNPLCIETAAQYQDLEIFKYLKEEWKVSTSHIAPISLLGGNKEFMQYVWDTKLVTQTQVTEVFDEYGKQDKVDLMKSIAGVFTISNLLIKNHLDRYALEGKLDLIRKWGKISQQSTIDSIYHIAIHNHDLPLFQYLHDEMEYIHSPKVTRCYLKECINNTKYMAAPFNIEFVKYIQSKGYVTGQRIMDLDVADGRRFTYLISAQDISSTADYFTRLLTNPDSYFLELVEAGDTVKMAYYKDNFINEKATLGAIDGKKCSVDTLVFLRNELGWNDSAASILERFGQAEKEGDVLSLFKLTRCGGSHFDIISSFFRFQEQDNVKAMCEIYHLFPTRITIIDIFAAMEQYRNENKKELVYKIMNDDKIKQAIWSYLVHKQYNIPMFRYLYEELKISMPVFPIDCYLCTCSCEHIECTQAFVKILFDAHIISVADLKDRKEFSYLIIDAPDPYFIELVQQGNGVEMRLYKDKFNACNRKRELNECIRYAVTANQGEIVHILHVDFRVPITTDLLDLTKDETLIVWLKNNMDWHDKILDATRKNDIALLTSAEYSNNINKDHIKQYLEFATDPVMLRFWTVKDIEYNLMDDLAAAENTVRLTELLSMYKNILTTCHFHHIIYCAIKKDAVDNVQCLLDHYRGHATSFAEVVTQINGLKYLMIRHKAYLIFKYSLPYITLEAQMIKEASNDEKMLYLVYCPFYEYDDPAALTKYKDDTSASDISDAVWYRMATLAHDKKQDKKLNWIRKCCPGYLLNIVAENNDLPLMEYCRKQDITTVHGDRAFEAAVCTHKNLKMLIFLFELGDYYDVNRLFKKAVQASSFEIVQYLRSKYSDHITITPDMIDVAQEGEIKEYLQFTMEPFHTLTSKAEMQAFYDKNKYYITVSDLKTAFKTAVEKKNQSSLEVLYDLITTWLLKQKLEDTFDQFCDFIDTENTDGISKYYEEYKLVFNSEVRNKAVLFAIRNQRFRSVQYLIGTLKFPFSPDFFTTPTSPKILEYLHAVRNDITAYIPKLNWTVECFKDYYEKNKEEFTPTMLLQLSIHAIRKYSSKMFQYLVTLYDVNEKEAEQLLAECSKYNEWESIRIICEKSQIYHDYYYRHLLKSEDIEKLSVYYEKNKEKCDNENIHDLLLLTVSEKKTKSFKFLWSKYKNTGQVYAPYWKGKAVKHNAFEINDHISV